MGGTFRRVLVCALFGVEGDFFAFIPRVRSATRDLSL